MSIDFQDALDHRIRCAKYVVTPGVYFLFDDDELVYVGQSTKAHARVAAHILEDIKEFNCFAVLECSATDLNETEAEAIVRFNPKYNRAVPGNKKWIGISHLRRLTGMDSASLKAHIRENDITSYPFNLAYYFNVHDFISLLEQLGDSNVN